MGRALQRVPASEAGLVLTWPPPPPPCTVGRPRGPGDRAPAALEPRGPAHWHGPLLCWYGSCPGRQGLRGPTPQWSEAARMEPWRVRTCGFGSVR